MPTVKANKYTYLIKNEEIGRCEHHAAQRETSFFTTTEALNLLLHSIALEKELAQQCPKLIV